MENKINLREELAELEHVQWSHWTAHMIGNWNDKNVKRWAKQILTPYEKLSEKEKDSDREWADRVLIHFEDWKERFIKRLKKLLPTTDFGFDRVIDIIAGEDFEITEFNFPKEHVGLGVHDKPKDKLVINNKEFNLSEKRQEIIKQLDENKSWLRGSRRYLAEEILRVVKYQDKEFIKLLKDKIPSLNMFDEMIIDKLAGDEDEN